MFKRSMWVLESKPERWLFAHANNNQSDALQYHLGGLNELARGHELIYGDSAKDIRLTNPEAEWNLLSPEKVQPRKIVLTWHYYNRPNKEEICLPNQ